MGQLQNPFCFPFHLLPFLFSLSSPALYPFSFLCKQPRWISASRMSDKAEDDPLCFLYSEEKFPTMILLQIPCEQRANPLHVMLCGWQSCMLVMLQTCRGRLLIREEWGGSCSPISKEGWLGGEFWMWRTRRRKQEKEEYAVIVVVKDRGFWFCYRSQRMVRIWTSWERGDILPLGIFGLKPSPETEKITHRHCKDCCTLLLGLKVGEQIDEARTREGQRDERMKRPFSSLVILGKN